MTATLSPIRVTVTGDDLTRAGWHQDEIESDSGLSIAAGGFLHDQVFDRQVPDEDDVNKAMLAWERLVDEVIREVSPQIGDLIYEGLQRRLPWTWEPER